MKNGEKFAVKVSTESEQDEGTNGGALRREYATLSSLKHPNIVRALQIWQGHVDEGMKGSAMILEFCGGIRLSRRLPWSDATFQLAARRKCLWQIADAVAYLHSLLVAHRDLHCKNVLVNEVGKDIEVKVLDFGCARPLNSDGGVEEDVNVNILPVGSTQPCDIFAMGLIGCSIISGKEISSWGVVPPDGESSITLPACGAKDFRLTGLMSEYLLGMLEVNGERRFKAPEALSRLPEESQWLMTQPKKLSL
ncbi:Probable serine/threonine-protein kinase kinY (DdKinY) [Durusdinium trenchii]|uniref:Probable serine/threonine-protein kinase kinY (DdKinY) n=1 Tax=Durusdinium trenchii TaxID=1381693 RepID=A0ABP0R1M0_9DINO